LPDANFPKVLHFRNCRMPHSLPSPFRCELLHPYATDNWAGKRAPGNGLLITRCSRPYANSLSAAMTARNKTFAPFAMSFGVEYSLGE